MRTVGRGVRIETVVVLKRLSRHGHRVRSGRRIDEKSLGPRGEGSAHQEKGNHG